MPTLITVLYAWACNRLYAELAWSYDWVAALVSGGRWSRWRRFALDYLAGPVVLELGSGPGHLLIEGAQRGCRMIGLDSSVVMAAIAHRRVAKLNLPPGASSRPICLVGRGEAIPLPSAAVDQVVATFPAPYILAPETLAECRRVLRPGGALIVVGLWVDTTLPLLRSLPVFYGPLSPALRTLIQDRAARAGFVVSFEERDDGPFHVGVMSARPLPASDKMVSNPVVTYANG